MLFIFIEGTDDSNYFEKIWKNSFGECAIIEYAKMPQIKLNNFLRSVNSMPNTDYLFFGDEDGKGIQNKMEELLSTYKCLTAEKVFIVQYEIESWYYAGVSQEDCKKLKLKHFQLDTNNLTKEQFCAKLLRPGERKYIMAQMLSCYSKELASERNSSFYNFYSTIKEPVAV